MENEFANADADDPFPLELTTNDPHAANVTREFDSFIEAAEENAFSRIFLGVHSRVTVRTVSPPATPSPTT